MPRDDTTQNGGPKRATASPDGEIRISSTGRIPTYIEVAEEWLKEHPKVVLTSTGNALPRAVLACETLKRRVKGLHQLTFVGVQEIVDVKEGAEGEEPKESKRQVSYIELTLSTEQLDVKNPGYQAPLDESLVGQEGEQIPNPRKRMRKTGKGKGKGDSDKSGKEEEGEAGEEGEKKKGKGKKSKGKGKGRKGKGRGRKGKGKGKKEGEDGGEAAAVEAA